MTAAPEPEYTADQKPCRCHDSHAAVTPFHSGHCCFFPPDQTCHPQEVATWEAIHDRERNPR